jgi:PAS domain S-box-containing protein
MTLDLGDGSIRWSGDSEVLRARAGLPSMPATLAQLLAAVAPEDAARFDRALDGSASPTRSEIVEILPLQVERGAAWLVQGLWETGPHGPRFSAVVLDGSSQWAREQALRRAEAKYRLFTELASDYVYVVDLNTRPLRPEIVAGSFERTTGYTAEEVEAAGGWLALIHPDDRGAIEDATPRVRAGERFVSEYRIRAKDRTYRALRDRVRGVASQLGGPVDRVIGGVTDITEQRALAEKLSHAQKLDAVGRLAAGIAHDLNNVLTVIHAVVDDVVVSGAPCVDANRIAAAQQAVYRATELTRSLLLLGRRSPAGVVPTVDVAAVLSKAYPLFAAASGKSVSLEVDIAPGPMTVTIDPGELQLAVLNLIGNARDAVSDHGRITMRVALEEYHEPASAGWMRIEVEDDGPGIPPDHLPHVLEPFYTTKAPGAGTGLGLATVAAIVDRAGGEVRVSSISGRGARFTLRLPLRR